MSITLLGVIFFVLSIWQFYWSFKGFQEFKKTAQKDTSNSFFRAFGYSWSFYFSLILLVTSIGMLVG